MNNLFYNLRLYWMNRWYIRFLASSVYNFILNTGKIPNIIDATEFAIQETRKHFKDKAFFPKKQK